MLTSNKKNFLLIILLGLFLFSSLLFLSTFEPTITGHVVSEVSIINSEPVMNSINTYSLYILSEDNKLENDFTICNNEDIKEVHIQASVNDADGFESITNVTFKIVLLNETTESDFDRFGTDFIALTFESGSRANAIYTSSFNMSINDSEREHPLYYRIKSKVSDGISTSATLDVNYTFIKEACEGFTNDSFIATANETIIINGIEDVDTSIEILTNATVNGSFSITKTSSSPVSFTDFGVIALNKYIDIAVSPIINQSLTSVIIKIYYTDAEVSAVGIIEDNLNIYNWNGTNWAVMDNSTVDTTNNFVSGTINHFSLFALFGGSVTIPSVIVGGKSTGNVGSGGFVPPAEEPQEEPKEEEKAEPMEEDTRKKVLFDIIVELIESKISAEDNLDVKVTLVNFGVPGKVNVSLYYEILDLENNVILTEDGTITVETQIEFIKTFKLPSTIELGDYKLFIKLLYGDNQEAVSQSSFQIVSKEKRWASLIMLIILVALVSHILITILRKKNKKRITKIVNR